MTLRRVNFYGKNLRQYTPSHIIRVLTKYIPQLKFKQINNNNNNNPCKINCTNNNNNNL